jgi:glycine cleavage system H protein
MAETRFTKDHEWVRLDGEVAVVGITEHAQEALGDVVFVDLPEAGREVEEGESIATVESVKAASDVYAPLSGKIIEANQAVADEPALVNRAADGDGWFFKMELTDRAAFDTLMDQDAYTAFVASL